MQVLDQIGHAKEPGRIARFDTHIQRVKRLFKRCHNNGIHPGILRLDLPDRGFQNRARCDLTLCDKPREPDQIVAHPFVTCQHDFIPVLATGHRRRSQCSKASHPPH